MNSSSLIIKEQFNSLPDKVWKAITDIYEIHKWYFPEIPAFKPQVGFETKFNISFDNKNYMHIWKVTDVQTGKRIAYDWQYEGYPGHSNVCWEIIPRGEETELILTHTGLESFPQDNPDFAIESFSKGWTEIIKEGLKKYLSNL